MSFSDRAKFYHEPYLSPKDERGLLEFGILPDLKGIYCFDESEAAIDARAELFAKFLGRYARIVLPNKQTGR